MAGRQTGRWPVAEILRYGAASALALFIDFGTLVLLTELAGVHYLTSAAVGFSLGVFVAYTLSVRWVFSVRRLASIPAESAIFAVIGLAGLAINHAVMLGLTEFVQLPYAVSKAASAFLVFAFNFSLRKGLLFTISAAPKG